MEPGTWNLALRRSEIERVNEYKTECRMQNVEKGYWKIELVPSCLFDFTLHTTFQSNIAFANT